jgi:hypothetical protein
LELTYTSTSPRKWKSPSSFYRESIHSKQLGRKKR